jgi:hypothetical protein
LKEREGDTRFQLRERKWLLRKILTTKTIDFCIKMFHMMKGVTFKCLFTLKTHKTYSFELEKNFYFGWISGFGAIYWLFGSHVLV